MEIIEEKIMRFNYNNENEIGENNYEDEENNKFGYNQTIDDDNEYNQINSDDEYNEEEFDYYEQEENEEKEVTDEIDDCNIIKHLNGTCKVTNISKINKITGEIIDQIENGNLVSLFKEAERNGKPQILYFNNTLYQFTTVISQKNICKSEYNYSSIDFHEFSDTFKRRLYEFSNDFYLFKIGYFFDGYKIPLIEYNLYNEVAEQFEKVNLNKYKDKLVRYYLPISINQKNEFKYNPMDNYYNHICYSYTSEKGKDVILYDRKDEFNKLKMSICEKDCVYLKYDFYFNKQSNMRM